MFNLPDSLPASTIAAVCGVVIAVALVAIAIDTVRRARRAWRTLGVAQELVDVHMRGLDATSELVVQQTSAMADASERLHRAIASLAVGARTVVFMLTSVSRERDAMRRRILDVLLPTFGDESDDEPGPGAARAGGDGQ